MSLARCQEEVDSEEFAEWVQVWQLEPFGDEWRQTALLAAITANPWRKDGSRAFSPEDFLPVTQHVKQQDPRVMEAIFRATAGA